MLKKIMFVFIVLFVCNTAYASEMISKDIPKDTNQFIRISTKGGTWKLDYRCLPVFSFEISESKQGLLQEGKTIYFASDSAFSLEKPNAVTCQNGNVDLQMDTIQTANKNIYAMRLRDIEHQKNLPLTIQFTLSPYIDRVSAQENIDVFFPLELITGSEYSDNIFLKNENEIILLNDKFFNVTQVATNSTIVNNNLMQPIEIQLEQQYFEINEKQKVYTSFVIEAVTLFHLVHIPLAYKPVFAPLVFL